MIEHGSEGVPSTDDAEAKTFNGDVVSSEGNPKEALGVEGQQGRLGSEYQNLVDGGMDPAEARAKVVADEKQAREKLTGEGFPQDQFHDPS